MQGLRLITQVLHVRVLPVAEADKELESLMYARWYLLELDLNLSRVWIIENGSDKVFS